MVGWILSQVWQYLLIGGAAALVGWLAWVVARTFRTPPLKVHLANSSSSHGAAPPPDDRFRAVLAVDPTVFDDSVLAEAAALKVFAAWAAELPMAPADPTTVVRSLDLRVRHIGRLETEVAERKIVWREAPYAGHAPLGAPSITPERVDAWTTNADDLRRESRYLASCSGCSGKGKVMCRVCAGNTIVKCANCDGTRKAYGIAKNGARRLMNCVPCEAKGELPCTHCANGKTACSVCPGSGRIERWLEIVETVRVDVQIEPDGEMTRAFRWGTDGTAATRSEIEGDAKIACELSTYGPVSLESVERLVAREWIAANWQKLQPNMRGTERARRQTFWLLEVPSIELSYGVAGAKPTPITLEGRRMLVPPASVDSQFVTRAQRLRLVRYVAFGLSGAIAIAYLMRGSYFWSASVAALTACSLAVAFAVDGFMRRASLGQRAAKGWAIGAATAAIFAGASAFAAEPRVRAAKRYAAAGNIEQAKRELQALGNANEPPQADAWADVAVAEAAASNDIATVAKIATTLPPSLPQRALVAKHLFALESRAVEDAIANKRASDVEGIVSQSAAAFEGTALVGQVGELRARVYDAEIPECPTDACRWRAAIRGWRLAPSTSRDEQLAGARKKMLANLTTRPRGDESHLERLQAFDTIAKVASTVLTETASADEELKSLAREAQQAANNEREGVALFGAHRDVVVMLLGLSAGENASTLKQSFGVVTVACAMRDGKCEGVYIVGNTREGRALNDASHATDAIRALSQAVGHKLVLPDPPPRLSTGKPQTTTWHEGVIPIAARWRGADLIELRIGRAAP